MTPDPGVSPVSDLFALPDGTFVRGCHRYEVDFLYDEIFERRVYLRNGIVLPERPHVIDVGANIGLFTLFVMRERPLATVDAFEPVPELRERLAANVSVFGTSVRIHPTGLSDRDGEATLVHYEDYTLLSGFHADPEKDAELIRDGIRDRLRGAGAASERLPPRILEEIVRAKVRSRSERRCPIQTLSSALRASAIGSVDLLKIDAERSEREVLAGIEDVHWPGIRQIVMEVHSPAEIEGFRTMLRGRGFELSVDREPKGRSSGVSLLYARRP
ncbi:MAG TPA: FkbM family methyltransferase [Thermoanaerobaculia bacterium]|nr:FkbM family methyltransferase [Thermoanaerobaculia bacterium]